ncbi:hypothetical protein O1L60_01495 [Streptomyces diastatochromogenes]|nr:hypothetical protein [Streptomyces diastatochromogenes]
MTVVAVLPEKKRLPAFREDLEGSFLEFVRSLPDAPDIDSAERITKITGAVDYPLHTRAATAPGLALIGDAALTGDPCGVWVRVGPAVRAVARGGGRPGRDRGGRARQGPRGLRAQAPAAARRPPVPGGGLRQGPPLQPHGAADVLGGGARRRPGAAHAPVRVPADRSAALPQPRGGGEGGGREPPAPRA